MWMNILVFSGIISLAFCQYTYTDESNLHTALTTGYEKTVRPSEKTDISMMFGLMSIADLDIVSQEFAVTGFAIATWNDSRLVWSPASYSGITYTMMKFSDIWMPPLLVNNAADGIKIINDDSDLASVYAYVTTDGEVNWLAPVNAITQCAVNIEAYPFDTQTCSVIISSWMFSTDMLYFTSSLSYINLDLYTENGEWDLDSTSVDNITRTLLGFPMSCLEFTMTLRRKYSYYVINMLLPVTMLAFLAPFQFLLPMEAGEQNGYSLTVLLSLSVVMGLVADSIPPTATHISILSVYLLVTYLLCSCQTVHTVFMTRFHSMSGRGHKMSKRINKITRVLAKLTFYSRPEDDDDESEAKPAIIVDANVKERGTPVAWQKKEKPKLEDSAKNNKEEIVYSYEEFVLIMNNMNFYIYFIVTCIFTLVFMIMLRSM